MKQEFSHVPFLKHLILTLSARVRDVVRNLNQTYHKTYFYYLSVKSMQGLNLSFKRGGGNLSQPILMEPNAIRYNFALIASRDLWIPTLLLLSSFSSARARRPTLNRYSPFTGKLKRGALLLLLLLLRLTVDLEMRKLFP